MYFFQPNVKTKSKYSTRHVEAIDFVLQSDDEGIGEVLNNNGSSDSRKS